MTVRTETTPSATTAATPAAPATDDRLARRNALVLAAAQAIGGSTATITFATAGLAGVYLMPERPALATAPISAFVIGMACGTVPAAMLMGRFGRRTGFLIGALTAMAGGLGGMMALFQASFGLFVVATFVSGVSQAFVQQYRFAAADTASDRFKPKAVSWVMAGGILAGVVGPQAVIATMDLFDPILFAGPYAAQAGLATLSCLVLAFLRAPPPRAAAPRRARGFRTLLGERRLRIAVVCGVVSYSLMTLVMTAAPLAMVACGLSQTEATLGIQWHVLAMYGPSFFTGGLIARYGAERIVGVGLVLLALCGVVALMGLDLAHFWTALILLGLGWNFGFIGATSMLVALARPEERAEVQAANDLLVFGTVAVASLASGQLLDGAGWAAVNAVMIAIVVVCAGLLARAVLTARRAA